MERNLGILSIQMMSESQTLGETNLGGGVTGRYYREDMRTRPEP